MGPHLDTRSALCRLAGGKSIPPAKFTALRRLGWIRVIGHGARAKPVITESGRERLPEGVGA